MLKKLSQQYGGQLFIVLVLFTVCRVLSITTFYYGFLQSFEKLGHLFFGKSIPAFISFVPFHSFSIIFSSLLHPVFFGVLFLFCAPLFWYRKQIKEQFAYSNPQKIIVFSSAFLLSWELCTYDYNYYLDNAFYLDRVILILFPFLLLRFPLLTPVFVAFAFVYRSQFNYPVDGFELYDKRFLFDLLVMFITFMYAKLMIRDLKVSFLFLALCIIAPNYFWSGFEKIKISPHGFEWLLYNDPSDMFMNVHVRGWLAASGENTIHSIYSFLHSNGKYLQALVFLTELAAIFMLRSRKTAIILLISLCFLHLGIFVSGSMLFWKWMLMDLLFAYILWKKNGYNENELFSKQTFLLSLPVIILSVVWLRPLQIGWHDTRVNQFFTYEIEDDKKQKFELGKNQMDPYHQWFQYDKFMFLVDTPCLKISGFGYTANYKLAKLIREKGLQGFLGAEKEKGENHFDPIQKKKYETFIQAYFLNKNKRGKCTLLPTLFHAPHHLYSGVFDKGYKSGPITVFRVFYNQTYSVNGITQQVKKKMVDEIRIAY